MTPPMVRYSPVPNWAQAPEGLNWNEVAAVATDEDDRVYVFNRGAQPMWVLRADGSFVSAWGEGLFRRAHGLTFSPEGTLFCTDDADHTVREFTRDGRLLMTLGVSNRPSDTGATSVDFRTIRQSAGPFHYPCSVAFAPDGAIYVADGYGNARIHRFSRRGAWELSWGEPGTGPGQFRIPHGIAVASDGVVCVADRENSRLQFFSGQGEFLDEWPEIARPCQVAFDAQGRLFVAELGYRAGMWPGTAAPYAEATGGRISVFNREAQLLGRWGGGAHPTAPGDFFAPHDLCFDSQGALYVAEVVMSAGGNRGLVDPSCHSLQKFTLDAH